MQVNNAVGGVLLRLAAGGAIRLMGDTGTHSASLLSTHHDSRRYGPLCGEAKIALSNFGKICYTDSPIQTKGAAPMDVKINQVILHILDAGASEPVLSDRPMELDADLYEYFSVCIEKAFASDDSKNCRFLPDSPFLQEMQHNDDFIDLSRRIAGVIFEQLLQYHCLLYTSDAADD